MNLRKNIIIGRLLVKIDVSNCVIEFGIVNIVLVIVFLFIMLGRLFCKLCVRIFCFVSFWSEILIVCRRGEWILENLKMYSK